MITDIAAQFISVAWYLPTDVNSPHSLHLCYNQNLANSAKAFAQAGFAGKEIPDLPWLRQKPGTSKYKKLYSEQKFTYHPQMIGLKLAEPSS